MLQSTLFISPDNLTVQTYPWELSHTLQEHMSVAHCELHTRDTESHDTKLSNSSEKPKQAMAMKAV